MKVLADDQVDLVVGGAASGTTVALFNHNSPSPSGNPDASAGPGLFFPPGETSPAVLAVAQPPGQA